MECGGGLLILMTNVFELTVFEGAAKGLADVIVGNKLSLGNATIFTNGT